MPLDTLVAHSHRGKQIADTDTNCEETGRNQKRDRSTVGEDSETQSSGTITKGSGDPAMHQVTSY